MAKNSFGTQSELQASQSFQFHSLPEFEKNSGKDISRLPYSLKILLENLLRYEDDITVKKADIEAIANWDPKATPSQEIQFRPSRILLQDFTGVPAVCDLAAMRGAIKKLGGDPARINPLQPAHLVIDHSVQVDYFGTADSKKQNTALEFQRNRERYEFLKWGQSAFKNFSVVPPETGIVHQVNLEHLAQVAWKGSVDGKDSIYPDSLIGTDSHTTMINGLGVLGWGVGGIEAEAAMLGQPVTMLIPNVIGFRLVNALPAGTTATDLVLTVVEMLRKKGVVGKFVEFYGPGLASLTLADRATIANMAPEYGATVGLFPVDHQTTAYLELTGRKTEAEDTQAYFQAQGMWFDQNTPEPQFTDTIELDLASVVPSLAGPSRPQDRVALDQMKSAFNQALPGLLDKGGLPSKTDATVSVQDPAGNEFQLEQGSVVIAAITSCTNTSNPSVLMAAGLLAKKAVEKGLSTQPWVKTSLAPGSRVVTEYLQSAGLMAALNDLKFNVVGYGCTTCIGNSGPLPDHIAAAVESGSLVVSSVLSGNRNFEGRISPLVRANYLASPPLVVAYALAGSTRIDLTQDPLGNDKNGNPVYLKDIWPSSEEILEAVTKNVNSDFFKKGYEDVFEGSAEWKAIQSTKGDLYDWNPSTYIKEPPFFENMSKEADPPKNIHGARVLALLKDSVTTDHISPAGNIQENSPAGQYLIANGVEKKDFNSFGSRRGNHEVMLRGTFGNIRLKNQLAPGTEGPHTKYFAPDHSTEDTWIYDASMRYQQEGTPLVVLAGTEYGTGSSRDWAAKGTKLLGVNAVIAKSFERIHRSNLIGMGVLPLEFNSGEGADQLGLNGSETFDIEGISELKPRQTLTVRATSPDGKTKDFKVTARIDTPNELEYYRHGGILQYVLRQALK